MADLAQLEAALVKADAAGNADDARAFASEIRRMRSEQPASTDVSMADRGRALMGGVNRGIAGLVGLPVDTAENVLNLGKAAIGAGATAFGRPDLAPDLTKGSFGGSEYIASLMNRGNINTQNPNPQDMPSRMLNTAGTVIGGSMVPGARPVSTLAAGGAAAVANEIDPRYTGVAAMAPSMAQRVYTDTRGATLAAKQAENIGRDTTAAASREAGYTIPTTQTNPTIVNRALEGISGKLTTAQQASAKNQPITNQLAKRSLGLPNDQPITEESLSGIRETAGKSYEAVKQYGASLNLKFKPDPQFEKSVDSLGREYSQAAKEFPEIAGNNEVSALKSALTDKNISPATAIELSKKLRFDASVNFKSDNPKMAELAHAQRNAATAIEDLIDRRLALSGKPDLIRDFRQARQMIARSYDVEAALNTDTNNVSAQKLAALAKNKPLGRELQTAASFANAFSKAAQKPETMGSLPGWSPLDSFSSMALGAGGAATGGPAGALAALLPVARPLIRGGILSAPYQRAMGAPSYNPLLNEPESLAAILARQGVLANR